MYAWWVENCSLTSNAFIGGSYAWHTDFSQFIWFEWIHASSWKFCCCGSFTALWNLSRTQEVKSTWSNSNGGSTMICNYSIARFQNSLNSLLLSCLVTFRWYVNMHFSLMTCHNWACQDMWLCGRAQSLAVGLPSQADKHRDVVSSGLRGCHKPGAVCSSEVVNACIWSGAMWCTLCSLLYGNCALVFTD